MRRLLLLIVVVLVVFVVVYRDRLYLRDPLGKVERDGRAVADARVFINYSNDVLMQEEHGSRMFVVQSWNHAATLPSGLTCIQGMMCLAPADRVVDAQAPAQQGNAVMSNREVSFTDDSGSRVHIVLR